MELLTRAPILRHPGSFRDALGKKAVALPTGMCTEPSWASPLSLAGRCASRSAPDTHGAALKNQSRAKVTYVGPHETTWSLSVLWLALQVPPGEKFQAGGVTGTKPND